MEEQHQQEQDADEHAYHYSGQLESQSVDDFRHRCDDRSDSRGYPGLTFPILEAGYRKRQDLNSSHKSQILAVLRRFGRFTSRAALWTCLGTLSAPSARGYSPEAESVLEILREGIASGAAGEEAYGAFVEGLTGEEGEDCESLNGSFGPAGTAENDRYPEIRSALAAVCPDLDGSPPTPSATGSARVFPPPNRSARAAIFRPRTSKAPARHPLARKVPRRRPACSAKARGPPAHGASPCGTIAPCNATCAWARATSPCMRATWGRPSRIRVWGSWPDPVSMPAGPAPPARMGHSIRPKPCWTAWA